MQDAIAVQSLKTDIALLRQHIFPPQYLEHVEGCQFIMVCKKKLWPIISNGKI